MCHRLRKIIDEMEIFESESSNLEPWISDAMQIIQTVNKPLQTVPSNAEELDNVTKVLSVCCFAEYTFISKIL